MIIILFFRHMPVLSCPKQSSEEDYAQLHNVSKESEFMAYIFFKLVS